LNLEELPRFAPAAGCRKAWAVLNSLGLPDHLSWPEVALRALMYSVTEAIKRFA